jgi:hypothetical protein
VWEVLQIGNRPQRVWRGELRPYILCVKANTLIPVPRIFGFDLSQQNGVGDPCAFVEFQVEAVTLEAHIQNQGGFWESEVRHILNQLVKITLEISSLRFDAISRLRFRSDPDSYAIRNYDAADAPLSTTTMRYPRDNPRGNHTDSLHFFKQQQGQAAPYKPQEYRQDQDPLCCIPLCPTQQPLQLGTMPQYPYASLMDMALEEQAGA